MAMPGGLGGGGVAEGGAPGLPGARNGGPGRFFDVKVKSQVFPESFAASNWKLVQGLKRFQVFPEFGQLGGHGQPIDRGGGHSEEPRHRLTRRCLGMRRLSRLSLEGQVVLDLRPPLGSPRCTSLDR